MQNKKRIVRIVVIIVEDLTQIHTNPYLSWQKFLIYQDVIKFVCV